MGENQSRSATMTTAQSSAAETAESKKRPSSPGKDGGKPREKRGDTTEPFKPKVILPANMEPIFYIGGGNGTNLIEEILLGLGWRRTKDKTDDNYKFRWTELKSQINYNKFREGEQIVNHIPNCNLLTNKLGLLNSLQEHERVCVTTKKRAIKLDFIPETYRLDEVRDRDYFLDIYQEGETWICKPTGRNQGKGIFLVRSPDEVKLMIQEKEEKRDEGKPIKPLNRIIQRYIHNPLLIEGRKFDIRCYMLVANTIPYLVLYHRGYIRLSMYEYDNDTENLIAHLTNQYIQKKDPSYQEKKEDTAWTMHKFNDYINENIAEAKGLEQDWLMTTFESRVKQILTYCFQSVKHKFQRKIGYFDLYGIDFMIDDDMKVWLIEVNVNPCLATNCEALKEAVPPIVKETIYIAIECFDKSRKGRPILPLQSMKGFQIIHSECAKPRNQGGSPTRPYYREKRSYSASPVRRPNYSPAKEPTLSFQERMAQRAARPAGPFARNGTRATATTLDVPQNGKPERRPPTRSGHVKQKGEDSKENKENNLAASTDKTAAKDSKDNRDGSKARPVVLSLSKAKTGGLPNSRSAAGDKDQEKTNTKDRKGEKDAESGHKDRKGEKYVESGHKTEKSPKEDEKAKKGNKVGNKVGKDDDKSKVEEKSTKESDDTVKSTAKGVKEEKKPIKKDMQKDDKRDISKSLKESRVKTAKEKSDTTRLGGRGEKVNSNANNNVISDKDRESSIDVQNSSHESDDELSDGELELLDKELEIERNAAMERQKNSLTTREKEVLKLHMYPNREIKRMPQRQKSPYASSALPMSSKPASITLRMSHNHSAHEKRTKVTRSKSTLEEAHNRGS